MSEVQSDIVAPMCMSCRHYDRSDEAEEITCSAYPDGIPELILESEVDHRYPYRGDRGITFDLDPRYPMPEGYLDMLFPAATAP
jgi:hypothetical protein